MKTNKYKYIPRKQQDMKNFANFGMLNLALKCCGNNNQIGMHQVMLQIDRKIEIFRVFALLKLILMSLELSLAN